MNTSDRKFLSHPSRGSFFLAGSLLLASIVVGLSGPALCQQKADGPRANILGYGSVTAQASTTSSGVSVTVFTCQDVRHADRLLDKLWADFSWDQLTGPKQALLSGSVPALMTARGASIAFARQGVHVYAIAAPSTAAATAALANLHIGAATAAFRAKTPRPAMLDYYDLRPISMNYDPFLLRGQDVPGAYENSFLRSELEKAHAFWQPFGFDLNYLTFFTMWGFGSPEPGQINTFGLDYTTNLARAHGQNVSVMFGNTPNPWWIRNKFPGDISETDPNALPSGMGIAGGAWLSMSAPDDAYAYVQDFATKILARLQQDAGDNLTMIRPIGGGRQGDELTLHAAGSEYLGYDECSQDGFRRWLREDRKLTLADMGKRWYGDPSHYKSWSEVKLPSEYDFFGGYDDDAQTLKLLTGWKWRPDRKSSDAEGWGNADYAPGSEWMDVDLAPSYRQFLLLNSQPDDSTQRVGKTAWFRKEFDITEFLAKHAGKNVYLVVSTRQFADNPVEIWINGTYIGGLRPHDVYMGPVAADISTLVHSGRNVVCAKVRDGVIPGPVFLTTHKPVRYPYLGPYENARFIDMRDWKGAEQLVECWRREALPARAQAPDNPLCLCPGGYLYADKFPEMKAEAGLTSIHDTGGFAASYSPELSGLAYAQGLNFTNEEGGTTTDEFQQTRQLAWLLLEGVNHHDYVERAQPYMEWEKKSGWFKGHQRLLNLVGKSVRAKPEIAILHTPEQEWRYFPYSASAVAWDIGRGPLQAAHYNNAYVTATEVENGTVDQYPVLVDSNTTVMSDELISAIERYVRAGGTFVALQGTGRSSLIDADTWPISRLTGFSVKGEKPEQLVTISNGNTVLKRFAGMRLPGAGLVLNWMGQNLAADLRPVGLSAAADGCVPLAIWEDGSIAAGMRTLGKGRVIVLGSTFWASKSDLVGNGYGLNGTVQTNFLSDLLDGLGVIRDVDCTSSDIWVRRVETKNGLQDWMVLWNSSTAPLADAGLTFPWPTQPARVIDEETGAPIAFNYSGGRVIVSKLAIDANGIRVIGVDRDDIAAAAGHWFGLKARYETAPEKPVPVRPPNPPMDVVTQIDKYQFRQIDDATASTGAWLKEDDAAAPWKSVGPGFWDEQGFSPTGIGVYRTKIKIPTSWQGQQILLASASNWTVFLGQPEAFVNGRDAGSACIGTADPSATFLDVTALVHPGVNDLAFLVKMDVARGGYCGGICIYPQPYLSDSLPITRWRLFSDDRNSSTATLPVNSHGRFLAADVDIPASWNAQEIFLDADQGNQRWIQNIMVNDRPICYNWFSHRYPNLVHTNLAPYIKPGRVNHIELWADPGYATTSLSLQRATIGVAATVGARVRKDVQNEDRNVLPSGTGRRGQGA